MSALPQTPVMTFELPALGALEDFSADERQALLSKGEMVQHTVDDRVIDETEAQTHLHFLVEGKMQVLRGSTFVADLYPGDLFGEMAVLNPPHATASVLAEEDSLTWRIHRDALRNLMEEEPETGAKLMRVMTRTFGQRL